VSSKFCKSMESTLPKVLSYRKPLSGLRLTIRIAAISMSKQCVVCKQFSSGHVGGGMRHMPILYARMGLMCAIMVCTVVMILILKMPIGLVLQATLLLSSAFL